MAKLPESVQLILDEYVASLRFELEPLIEGIYVTGSVALQDYYPNKSDIDFITVLKDYPDEQAITHIARIHRDIEDKYGQPKLNGYYLTLEGIANGRRSYPSFFKRRMYSERPFELAKLSLLELKTISRIAFGTSVELLAINVTHAEVIKELHHNINTYWTSWIRRHSPVSISYLLLLLFPRLTEWGVLGVARQLYTLETGAVTSKLQAGLYCLHKMPDNLKPAVQLAIKTRTLNKTQLRPSFSRARKTLAAMRFIVARFNSAYQTNQFQ